jgi:hypothetical protein
MISPEVSVGLILDALHAQPPRSPGTGRALMIVSARANEDSIGVARAVALASSLGAVYAIDLDLRRNGLAHSLLASGQPMGPRIDAALGGAALWGVCNAAGRLVREASAYAFHRLGRTNLYVGALNPRAIPSGGRVTISSAPSYWENVRAGGATAVVCAPALSESEISLRIAQHMDGVVLIVGSDAGSAPAALAAKNALDRAGANVMGLVYAGVSAPVMAMERLRRQIG